jgi:CheY-like chemotaxis protein
MLKSEGPLRKRLLIIGMSANSDSATRQCALNAGMDLFIPKPFILSELEPLIYHLKHEDQNRSLSRWPLWLRTRGRNRSSPSFRWPLLIRTEVITEVTVDPRCTSPLVNHENTDQPQLLSISFQLHTNIKINYTYNISKNRITPLKTYLNQGLWLFCWNPCIYGPFLSLVKKNLIGNQDLADRAERNYLPYACVWISRYHHGYIIFYPPTSLRLPKILIFSFSVRLSCQIIAYITGGPPTSGDPQLDNFLFLLSRCGIIETCKDALVQQYELI